VVDLVGLIELLPMGLDFILQPLATADLIPDRSAQPDLPQDIGVDLSGVCLADARVGQGKDVQIGSQSAPVADLAATEERLQGHRAAECHGEVRIAGPRHAEVHDAADEAGHT